MAAETNALLTIHRDVSHSLGYIGGSVLSRLLSHPDANSFDITAIVRWPEKAKKLESFGIKSVVGSFKTNLDLVEKLAEAAHVVFHCVCRPEVWFLRLEK